MYGFTMIYLLNNLQAPTLKKLPAYSVPSPQIARAWYNLRYKVGFDRQSDNAHFNRKPQKRD